MAVLSKTKGGLSGWIITCKIHLNLLPPSGRQHINKNPIMCCEKTMKASKKSWKDLMFFMPLLSSTPLQENILNPWAFHKHRTEWHILLWLSRFRPHCFICCLREEMASSETGGGLGRRGERRKVKKGADCEWPEQDSQREDHNKWDFGHLRVWHLAKPLPTEPRHMPNCLFLWW